MSKIIGNNWIKSSFLKTKKLPPIKCSHNYLHWHWLTHIVGQVTGVWHDIAARLWPTYLCKLSHTATAGCLHFVAFELSGGLSQCKRKQWRVEQRARHTVVSSTLTKFEQSLPHDTWYIMSHTHMIHNVSDIGQQKKQNCLSTLLHSHTFAPWVDLWWIDSVGEKFNWQGILLVGNFFLGYVWFVGGDTEDFPELLDLFEAAGHPQTFGPADSHRTSA